MTKRQVEELRELRAKVIELEKKLKKAIFLKEDNKYE